MHTAHRMGAIAASGAGAGGAESGTFDGETGFTDFSEQPTVDVAPADWTSRIAKKDTSATVELTVRVLRASSIGGQMLVIDTESDGFNGSFKGVITWDIPGVIGTSWEALMVLRAATTGSHGPAYSSNDAPSGGLYTPAKQAGVGVSPVTAANLRDFKKDAAAGDFGAGTNTGTGLALTNLTRHYLRVRRDGNRYRARVWALGTSEPGTWVHDATEGLFSSTDTGLIGLMLVGYTGQASHTIQLEYLSISNNPGSVSAPLPADEAKTGGNFGAVDMTTAAVSGAGFVHYPLTASSTVALSMVARGGSKHGTVLKVDCPSGSHRGFVNWVPGGYCADGDVLALIEVGGSKCGPGVAYAKAVNGGIYNRAHRSHSLILHASDRVDWCRTKTRNDEDAWPAGLNTGVNTGAIAPAEKWWVRQRKTGAQIQMRAWKDGTSEPGTWYVDNSAQLEYDVVGLPSIGYDTGGAATFYVEHLAWTDDPSANPVNPV